MGGQTLNGGLLAVSGWDNEILARKFGMVEVKNFHFLKNGFSSHLGGGQSKCDICHKIFGFFF